ncbi:unnamed protein product [Lymnaea stagnalis]|uniref:Mannosyltransferase n=1 Tax=Lymnaea stagnalis TaxID=6523 RepID=A0AAV2HHH3_LYMST
MGRRKKVASNKRPQTCRPNTGADPGRSRAERAADRGRGVASTDEDLLPRWTSAFVVLVTWSFRVYYVISPWSWWVLHPDEIFQTMEVAHTELYGYGVRPYEFLGPPKGDNMSLLELKEKELGMWAMRSPLVPQFFMLTSTLVAALGFEPNPFLLWRVAHVSVTSWLPFAICTYVTSVTRSRDAGSVAAILIAISSHLTVFGTHTLVNSLVSPFLFLSLSHVTQLLQGEKETICEKPERSSLHVDVTMTRSDPVVNKAKWNLDENIAPNQYARSESHTSKLSDPGYCTGMDENSISDNDSNRGNEDLNGNNTKDLKDDDLMQRLPETYYTNGLKDDHTDDIPPCHSESHVIHKLSRALTSVLAGLFLALTVYVRPDASLLVSLMILTHLKFPTVLTLVLKKPFWFHVLGAIMGVAIAVADDFYFFGCFVLSPINWVKFNLFSGQTSQLFGSSGKYFYFEQIFLKDFGLSVLTVIFTSAMIILALSDVLGLFNKLTGFSTTPNSLSMPVSRLTECRGMRGQMTSVIFLTGIYSTVGHKESRFLHDVIVLYLGVLAIIITAVIRTVSCSRHKKRFLLLAFGSFLLANQWASLHEFEKSHPITGSHSSPDDGLHINQCLYYVSSQNDVRGLYMENSLLDHGSFTLLHKNVPVLFLHDRKFIEFDRRSLISSSRYCWVGTNCTSEYYAMSSVSDLIDESNHQFILKRIIESKHFNYAIIQSDKGFFQPLFTKVLSTKTFSVWKRNYDPAEEEKMSKLSSQIPYGGTNTTLVEYEGEVLKLHGSYNAAVQRFQAALSRERVHASVYASMAFCLHRMGQVAAWRKVLRLCKQKYSEEECMDGARVRVINGIL